MRGLRTLLLLVLTLAAAGCGQQVAPWPQPYRADASYRLTFNGSLVGEALFSLEIDRAGRYRLQALTVPAGKMARAAGHEILEVSEGTLSEAGVRPARFDYSVIDAERGEHITLEFDWDAGQLALHAGGEHSRTALFPGVQDRLSYLLSARLLALHGAAPRRLQIAAPDSAQLVRLEPAGRRTLETAAGPVEAVGVRRLALAGDEVREIWFDPGADPLPLRLGHGAEGSRVEMELVLLSRRPSDPR